MMRIKSAKSVSQVLPPDDSPQMDMSQMSQTMKDNSQFVLMKHNDQSGAGRDLLDDSQVQSVLFGESPSKEKVKKVAVKKKKRKIN